MNAPAPASSSVEPPPSAKARRNRPVPLWIVGMLIAIPSIALILWLAVLITSGSIVLTLPRFGPEAQRTSAQAKGRALEAALISYKIQNGFTPSQSQGLKSLVTPPSDPRVKLGSALVKPDALLDPWGQKFQYRNPGTHNPNSYDLFSLGPDGIESADDIGNW